MGMDIGTVSTCVEKKKIIVKRRFMLHVCLEMYILRDTFICLYLFNVKVRSVG